MGAVMANWDDYYRGAAEQYDIDPQLLRAIVQTESNANPSAVSSAGAVGPAQILPSTAKSLGVNDPTDPRQAIYGAAKLLDENLRRYGNVQDAVRAYHGGTDQTEWGAKTQDYLSKVTKAYQDKVSGNPQVSDDEILSQWVNASPSSSESPEDAALLNNWVKGGLKVPSAVTPQAEIGDTSGLNPLEKFGVGFVKGVGTIGNTIGNVLDPAAQFLENRFGTLGGPSVTEAAANRAESNRLYQQDFGGSKAATLGEIVGSTAATAPLLASGTGALEAAPYIGRGLTGLRSMGVLGRGAANALTGAAQGAGGAALLSGNTNVPAGQQIESGALIGGALGPAAPLVQKAGSAVGRFFMKSPEIAQTAENTVIPILAKEGIDFTKLSPAVQASVIKEATTQAATGKVNPQSLARLANLEDLGLTPTKSLVNRDPIQWAQEREAAKQAGNPLMQVFQNNNAILRNHLADVEANSGGVASSAEDAGDSAISAATSKFREWQNDVSNAYKQVEQQIGPEKIVSLNGLKNSMEPLSDKTAGIPVVDAIKRRLTRYGVIDSDGNWTGKLSVGNAEELRKFIADEATNDPAVNRIVRGLQNTLDNDVQASTGSDAFGQARQLAAQRFGEIDSSKITTAIMDEKINPAQFVKKFIIGQSTPANDLQAFKDTLINGTPDQIARGQQAFNNLRQQTANWIRAKATNGNIDEGSVSYPRLKDALEAIGPRKLAIIFGDDGAAKYGKILRGAHDSSYEPGLAPVNRSNTSNALLNAAKSGAIHGASMLPGVGPLVRLGQGAANIGKNVMAQRQAQQFTRNALERSPPPNEAVTPNPLASSISVLPISNYLLQRSGGSNLPQESR
jgi:hypothetical protein